MDTSSTSLALEIPFTHILDATDIPEVHVDQHSSGEFKYEFIPSTIASSTRRFQGPQDTPHKSTRVISCRLYAHEPSTLHFQSLIVSTNHQTNPKDDHKNHLAQLHFTHPILPSLATLDTEQDSKIFLITADGYLHVISVPNAMINEPLFDILSTTSSITSIPLTPYFDRLGPPTCLGIANDHICIGTYQGTILCLPCTDPNLPSIFELTPHASLLSGLSGMLGGFLGISSTSPVDQITEIISADRNHQQQHRLLCSIHANSEMRLWSISSSSRHLVHNQSLLPPEEASKYRATHVNTAVEFIDDTNVIMLVFFRPQGTAVSSSQGGDASTLLPGRLCVFELFLEDRGGGILKVLVEQGPVLGGGDIHRVHDMVLQNAVVQKEEVQSRRHIDSGNGSIVAWLLCDDCTGKRTVQSLPVKFEDGAVPALFEVSMIEDQMYNESPSSLTDEQQDHRYKVADHFRTCLDDIMKSSTTSTTNKSTSGDDTLYRSDQGILDTVLSPGRYSSTVLRHALVRVGAIHPSHANSTALDMRTLRRIALEWTYKQQTNITTTSSTTTTMSVFEAWNFLLKTYTSIYRDTYLPIALILQQQEEEEEEQVPAGTHVSSIPLLIVRSQHTLSMLQPSSAVHYLKKGRIPPQWKETLDTLSKDMDIDRDALQCYINIERHFLSYFGGDYMLSMLRTCLLHGLDFRGHVLPQVYQSMLTLASPLPSLSMLLVDIGSVLSQQFNGHPHSHSTDFAYIIDTMLHLLASKSAYTKTSTTTSNNNTSNSSVMKTYQISSSLISACLAHTSLDAAEYSRQLLNTSFFIGYIQSLSSIGTFKISMQQQAKLSTTIAIKLESLIERSLAAYWLTSGHQIHTYYIYGDDLGNRKKEKKDGSQMKISPESSSAMVISLQLGERIDGTAAFKKARITPIVDAYPFQLLLLDSPQSMPYRAGISSTTRAIGSITTAMTLFTLGLDSDTTPSTTSTSTTTSTYYYTKVASALLSSRNIDALLQFTAMLHFKNTSSDLSLLLYTACAKLLTLHAASPHVTQEEQKKLEEESIGLFFRVASVFTETQNNNNYNDDDAYIRRVVEDISMQIPDVYAYITADSSHHNNHHNLNLIDGDDGASTETQCHTPALLSELEYYELLMSMYECMGCAWAASRCALAAVKHVEDSMEKTSHDDNNNDDDSLMQQEQYQPQSAPDAGTTKYAKLKEKHRRAGRLWCSVFTFCIQSGDFEESYSSILANEVPELQIECIHRLVNTLCEAGEIATLCALPFAEKTRVVHSGRPSWTSYLNEAIDALRRRASRLDLDAQPQPYKVLFDFYVSRGNYQAAATSMVTYARRLANEKPRSDAHAVMEAQHALGVAVAALATVDSSQAYVEDPMPAWRSTREKEKKGEGEILFGLGPTSSSSSVYGAPIILTLDDLRKEYAIMRARVAVGKVLTGVDLWKGNADDTLTQLLSLDLHDEAFALADSIYTGSQLHHARERCISSLAFRCAELQLLIPDYSSNSTTSTTTSTMRRARSSTPPHQNSIQRASSSMLMDMNVDEPTHYRSMRHPLSTTTTTIDSNDNHDNNGDDIGNGDTPHYHHHHMRSTAVQSASTAKSSWDRLRFHIEGYESMHHGKSESNNNNKNSDDQMLGMYRWRVVAVESILKAAKRNQQLCPPMWLLEPFFPAPSLGPLAAAASVNRRYYKNADVPGLIRVYMLYNREEEAARLALRYLKPLLEAVPSMLFKTPASVCLPHGVFDELCSRLAKESRLSLELRNALDAVNAVLERQTDVISEIYL